MDRKIRRNVLLFLAAAIALTTVLSTGLPSLRLGPGMPLPEIDSGSPRAGVTGETLHVSLRFGPAFRILLIAMAAAATGYAGYLLFRLVHWKSSARVVAMTLASLVAVGGILYLISRLFRTSADLSLLAAPPPYSPQERTPLGTAPRILFWIVLGVIVAAAILILVRFLTSSSRRATTGQLVGQEAALARRALLAGEGVREVVIRCYRRMSDTLEMKRGLERSQSATTREFEETLIKEGFPPESVRDLTRLFESVRYGEQDPSLADEERAIRCFEAIAESEATDDPGKKP